MLVLLVGMSSCVYGAPIAVTTGGAAQITIYDEPCGLTEIVKNAPNRVTWTDKGEVNEGCGFLHPFGIVVVYFNDRTIVVIPMSAFKKPQEV